jgi:predicted nucleotidyltransferase
MEPTPVPPAGNHQQSSIARSQRLPAIEAASAFIVRHFPRCVAAFLAGSASRGEATATSDLDLLIVDPGEEAPRWATFHEMGWPIEAFLLTPTNYATAFADQVRKRWALLPAMCRDGILLRDQDGLAQQMKNEAAAILDRGPGPCSEADMNQYRFYLTDTLLDFEAASNLSQVLLDAGGIFHLTATIFLAHRQQWVGQGKWLLRQLQRVDPEQAQLLTDALETVCRTGDKSLLLQRSDAVLALVGGRRFEGQSGPIQP